MTKRQLLEEAIIGAVFHDAISSESAWSLLKPEFFQTAHCQALAEKIDSSYQSGRQATIFEADEYLKEAFLTKERNMTVTGVWENAKILKDLHYRTEFKKALGSYDFDNANIGEILGWLEKRSEELLKTQDFRGLQSFEQVGEVAFKQLDDTASGKWPGLKTGFRDIDKHWSLEPGLTIIAGRPGMGKTSFALQLAQQTGVNCAFFSLEMQAAQLYNRELGKRTGLSQKDLKTPYIINKYKDKLLNAAKILNKSKVYVDDNPIKTVAEAQAQCKLMKNTKGLGAAFFDYVTLMKGSRDLDIRQRIGEISRGLARMAKTLNIPVVLLSQLNRDCEKRPDKRPLMADLKETGDLEQDAIMVLMLYCDQIYNPETLDKNIMEVLIRKARNGGEAAARLGCDRRLFNFYDL